MTLHYHKATLSGLVNLVQDFQTGTRICASSGESDSLFWREACLVLDVKKENIVAQNDTDIDSRCHSSYDECRLLFESKEQFLSAIKYIIIDGKIIRSIRAKKAKLNEALYESASFFKGDHADAEQSACKDFFIDNPICHIFNLTQARKINKEWDRDFLNL